MRKLLPLLAALLVLAAPALAQVHTVTGQVKDEKGDPIPFATITDVATKNGTQADANGMFSIKVKEGDQLRISAVGHAPQTVTVTGNVVNVTLAATAGALQEVVITTALGIKRQPKELGYSTAKVSNSDLTQAKVTNIATGLTAKVSGLQINTVNNGVNPTTRITLRGNRSILGNNQALLVLDDIPLPISNINTINPNDVENVTILKGASASALYGSAASNGVIIVTTKKGQRNRPVIQYSNTTTVEEVSYLPRLQNGFGGYGGEAFGAPGTIVFPENPFLPYVPYENQSYGPAYNGQKVTIGGPVRIYRADGTFYDSTATGIYSAKPDAKKNFFDKGITVQNDISYGTGDEKSRFYLSAQDVVTTGIVPGDKNHRDAFRINGSRENGKFRTDYSVGYTLTHTNTTPGSGVPSVTGPFAGQALFGGATGGSYFQNRPVYWTVINTPANIDLRDYKNWQTDPFANPNGYFNAYYGNPWWQIDEARLDERNSDLLGNIALNFRPWEWLNLTARGGIVKNDYTAKYTRAGFTFADWAIADPLGAGNIPSSVKKLDPQEGDVYYNGQRLTGDFLASFNKSVKDYTIKVIAGAQVVDALAQYNGISANALVIPDFYNITNRIGEPNVFQTKTQTRTIGAFGDATVGYKDFLFLHGSVRNDWVSVLAKSNRSYLYPGVDASFIFTDAFSTLHDNKILSFGKIHAAYSKTSAVSIGPYQLANTFGAAGGFPYGNVAGFTLNNTFANPDLTPEFTTEKEVGFELGFLKNRIYVTATYFDALTDHQTIPIITSSTTGYTGAVINTGEMSNKGIEFDLKVSPVVSTHNGLRWDLGLNFTYINNKLLSLGYGLTEVPVGGTSYAVIGKGYPQLKVSDWQRDSATGKIIIDPSNGFPTPDPTPKTYGTTNPPFKLGLNSAVSFKGFTLSGVAEFRSGAVIYNAIGSSLDFTGVSWNSARYNRQRFVIPNSVYFDGSKYVDNTSITTRDGNNEFWASTWNQVQSVYVTSADFWKLRELALTYQFPQKWIGKMKVFKAVSVGFIARNLFTWKPKENIWTDPEFSNSNGNGTGTTDINQTPPTRTFGGNLTVTF